MDIQKGHFKQFFSSLGIIFSRRRNILNYIKIKVRRYSFLRYWYLRLRGLNTARIIRLEAWVKQSIDLSIKHCFADFAFRSGKAYVITEDGCELRYLPDRPYSVVNKELRDDTSDRAELHLMKMLAKPSSVIMDIGANCGYYAISLARAFPAIQIHAFEPVPSTFKLLVHNCQHNGVEEKVTCNQLALGDQVGMITVTSQHNTGNYILPGQSVNDEDAIWVPITTLDQYIAERKVPSIDGIKCDVEGAELFMLRGSSQCIDTYHPWILLEIDHRWTQRYQYVPQELFDYMTSKGYIYWVISYKDQRLYPATTCTQDCVRGYNFFFCHQNSEYVNIINNLNLSYTTS